VASSGSATEQAPPTAAEDDVDLEALKKAKPIFLYFYVEQVTDPMDSNYKFSRKFELGVLQEEIVDLLNKSYICKKISLPAEADMKLPRNQARIEVWSPTKMKVGTIGLEGEAYLNKAPFLSFLRTRIAKSEKAVKDEVARIQKLRKEREEQAKKETAKKEE
jgi:hypothetical protein